MTPQERLEKYLSGQLSLRDLDEWLSIYDWDAPSTEEQTIAGRLFLLVTEVSEGLRSEIELRQEAAEILSLRSPAHTRMRL